MEDPKIPCTCPCHHTGIIMKHIMACCHNGFITIPSGDYIPEPLSPLAEKMMEAIFIKTGGRAENPKIAKLCAAIAEEHFKTIKIENNE